MKKFMLITGLVALSLQLNTAEAGIFGRRWNRQYYPAYNSGYYTYAPSTAAAPATAAAPVPANGFRSYSYEPTPQPNPDQPAEFQQFNPAYGYPTQQPRNETGEPYHDAGFKVRGF